MERENFKAIAEIIKNKLVGNDLPDTAKEIAEDLADYFEKEDLMQFNVSTNFKGKRNFNKKQFLKDARVE